MYQGSLPQSPRTSWRSMPSTISIELPPLQLTDDLPRRPPTVAAGVITMIATAFLGTFTALLSFVALHHFNAMFQPAVAPIGASQHFVDQVQTMVRTAMIATSVLSLIMSTVLVLLTVGILRGNRGARMGVWALCVFGTAWTIAVLVAVILAHSMMPLQSSDITAAAVVRTAEESVPGWFPGVLGFLSLAQALGYVAAAILLAAPSSSPFFRSVLRPWHPHAEPSAESEHWSIGAEQEQAGTGASGPAT